MAPRKQTKKHANGEGGVYHRPDGRWETKLFVDMPDGRRKRISVYVTSDREALNELNKLRDQQRRGIPIATTTLTAADYITYWLEHIAEPSIRRTTYATCEGDVRLHIVPGIGKRKLKTLQASEIRLWLNQLRTRCQCCAQGKDRNRKTPRCCAKEEPECCQDILSSSSIRHVLRVLRAALQDAVDEELLSRSVARLVQLRVTDDRKVRSFTRAEALRFLKAAEQHRLYALWAVALAMGLRRSEALGLAWSDVDLENGRLTIRQALHRAGGELRLEQVKTEASVAVLPIRPRWSAFCADTAVDRLKSASPLAFSGATRASSSPRQVAASSNHATSTAYFTASALGPRFRSCVCMIFATRAPPCCSRWVCRRQRYSESYGTVRSQ